jgi:hypothetical protein
MGAVTVGCCSGNSSGLDLKETSQKKGIVVTGRYWNISRTQGRGLELTRPVVPDLDPGFLPDNSSSVK